MRDMGVTTRNRKLYMDLVRDLEDLESTTFREHWYYRAMCFKINTNASMNEHTRTMYDKLLELARIYRREHRI